MAKIKDNSSKVLSEARRLAREKLETSALLVERTAKEICPTKTGTAKRSITHVISPDGKRAFVGSNVEYFPIIELGSAPHTIRPKTAKALFWKGAKHPVKVVHHPGTPAFAVLRRALHSNMKKIKKIFGA